MNIKSLLIGSAAALAAVSSASAADAIVAAEPEPLEYVRVCDAFGTGFFYIPGTETCLKIGGYVRFQTDFGRNKSGSSDWDSFTRAQLEIDTRSETEYGALRGFIGLRGNADQGSNRGVNVDQAFIELNGFKVGYFYSWWDDGLSGETDKLDNYAQFNQIRYTYDNGTFRAGVSVDELEGTGASAAFRAYRAAIGKPLGDEGDNNVGVSGLIGGTFGGINIDVIGSYDTDYEEGAVRAIATAKLGPGTLGLAAVWASDYNAYYAEAEWTVAVEYALQVTDKFKVTPGFQYFDKYQLIEDNDAWKAGLTLDYKIVDKLNAKVAVNYIDQDIVDDGDWTGFFRLQRSF